MIGWRAAGDGRRLLLAAVVVLGLAAPAVWAQTPAEIQAALDAAHATYKDLATMAGTLANGGKKPVTTDISNALGGNPLASRPR
jgi:hypothetical protein